MKIMNDIAIYVGWLTMAVLCWFLAWCLWQLIEKLADKLWWKIKTRSLHYKLYVNDVSMMCIPLDDYRRFMVSFKCDGYEDWFFYAYAKSWKEIGAIASKRWDDYLAERETAIKVVGNPMGYWKEYCENVVKRYDRPVDRPGTDGGDICVGQERKTEEERSRS